LAALEKKIVKKGPKKIKKAITGNTLQSILNSSWAFEPKKRSYKKAI